MPTGSSGNSLCTLHVATQMKRSHASLVASGRSNSRSILCSSMKDRACVRVEKQRQDAPHPTINLCHVVHHMELLRHGLSFGRADS